MGKNLQEYNALLRLREAFLTIPIVKKQIGELEGKIQNEKKEIVDLNRRIAHPIEPIARYTDELEQEYRKPFDAKDTLYRKKKARFCQGMKLLGLFCVTTVIFMITAALVAGIAWWSWTSAVDNAVEKFGDAVGVNAFSAAFYLLILLIWSILAAVISRKILNEVYVATEWIERIPLFYGCIAVLAGIGMFFAFLNCAKVEWVGAAYGSLILYSFVPVVALLLHIFPMGWIVDIFLNVKNNPRPYYLYSGNGKKIDFTPLYQTDVYQEAKKLDEEERPLLIEEDREYNRKKLVAHQNQLAAYQNVLAQYQKRLNESQKIIQSATFLNKSYRTLQWVNIFIYYMDHHRAETIVQAMNEYTHDKQIEAIKRTIGTSIDTVKTALEAEIKRVEKSLESQVGKIREDIAAAEEYRATTQSSRERDAREFLASKYRSLESELYNASKRLENAIRYS